MAIDETFDIGRDTRTPVDFGYEVPFRFTGTIDKLTYKLGPTQLSSEEHNAMETSPGARERLNEVRSVE